MTALLEMLFGFTSTLAAAMLVKAGLKENIFSYLLQVWMEGHNNISEEQVISSLVGQTKGFEAFFFLRINNLSMVGG